MRKWKHTVIIPLTINTEWIGSSLHFATDDITEVVLLGRPRLRFIYVGHWFILERQFRVRLIFKTYYGSGSRQVFHDLRHDTRGAFRAHTLSSNAQSLSLLGNRSLAAFPHQLILVLFLNENDIVKILIFCIIYIFKIFNELVCKDQTSCSRSDKCHGS